MSEPKNSEYQKPVLEKHETLREVTMACRGKGCCSTCSIWPFDSAEED